jgi:hypothetical protein
VDFKDYIQRQIAGGRRILDAAIKDTPAHMVNHKVGEHTNTIAAVYAHAIGAEDYFINTVINGGQRLWESNGWAEKLGITQRPGSDWSIQFPDLAGFQEYAKTVHAATDACIAALKMEDLDSTVTAFGQERQLFSIFMTITTHASGHGGEIATLKGVQGVKGMPF